MGAAAGGGGGRAAAQAGGAGSLPHSRCATAPPRGERLDRVVRGATPGWQALAPRSARSVRRWLPRVGAAAGGGRAAAQVGAVGSLPLSRCATAPPRGERLDRAARGATPGWQTSARGSARCVRRWLPRVGAAAGGGRAAAQVGGAGSLPLSRCATAPPRGERLDRAARGATPGWQALAPRSARSVRRWLPRVGAAAGGGRAAAQAGGAGSLPHSRCATAPPRGERLDRVVRGATPGWQTSARGSARCVRRWLPRSVAAPLCPLPAQGQASASSPAEWGERRSGRPIPGFGRPLLVADREERGSGLFRGFLDERFAVGGRALDLCGGDHSRPAARPAMRPKTEPAMRPEPPA